MMALGQVNVGERWPEPQAIPKRKQHRQRDQNWHTMALRPQWAAIKHCSLDGLADSCIREVRCFPEAQGFQRSAPHTPHTLKNLASRATASTMVSWCHGRDTPPLWKQQVEGTPSEGVGYRSVSAERQLSSSWSQNERLRLVSPGIDWISLSKTALKTRNE